MKSKILLIIAIIGLCSIPAVAQSDLAQKLSGRILLGVESKGEAWYVNPADQKRYFLGRPQDAFTLMRALGVGITNSDLEKIPPGLDSLSGADADSDGLPDAFEEALGTDKNIADTDSDGFSDKAELAGGFSPLGKNLKMNYDLIFSGEQKGKIFLQVESSGQAWYINPADLHRYFLGRPQDAWQIMRRLALGITDKNLQQIAIGRLQPVAPTNPPPTDQPPVTPPSDQPPAQASVLDQAAESIRNDNSTQAQSFFIPSMRPSIKYSVEHLSAESRLLLANILSGAKLESSSDTERIYSNSAYFSLKDVNVSLHFRVQKQSDGTWLVANL